MRCEVLPTKVFNEVANKQLKLIYVPLFKFVNDSSLDVYVSVYFDVYI